MKRLLVLLISLLIAAPHALSQPFPDRVVRIVVPYPPGGYPDVIGRLVAQITGTALRQQVIVENRGGVSGDLWLGRCRKLAAGRRLYAVEDFTAAAC